MSTETKTATVKATGEKVTVYKLREATPTPEHIWCNEKGCRETFKASELIFN